MVPFSRLKHLTFTFDADCRDQDYDVGDFIYPKPNYNQRLQNTLLGAVADSCPSLRLEGLSVYHLLCDIIHYPSSSLSRPNFAALLSSVKVLCVEGLSNGPRDFETGRHEEDTVALYSTTIPRAFLAPTQSSLTSLTLVADQLVEFWLNFDVLFFPHLNSLSLSRMMLDGTADPNTGVQGFVLRHRATLKRLRFNQCPLYLGERPAYGPVASARWANLWKELEQFELLIEVLLEHAKFEYVIHDPEDDPILGFWCPVDLEISNRGEDGPAFEHLKSVITERVGNIEYY